MSAALAPIRFAEPTRELAALGGGVEAEVLRVLSSGRYILGEEVEAFENELAAFIERPFAVGVSSGSDALVIALQALGLGPGDEVIVPAYSFVATAEAVLRVGAAPQFVDVRDDDALLDARLVERAIGPATRAILSVDLYGRVVDPGALFALGLPVVEDGAQVLGRRGAMTATLACTSFFPSKPLGAAGDGGAILTDDPRLAGELRALRQHGRRGPHRYDRLGGNYRLDALQAALLRVKLRRLGVRNERRLAIASEIFAACALTTSPTLPFVALRVHDVERAKAILERHGIASERHYPYILPELAPYRAARAGELFPVAQSWARQVICLPCHAELLDEEVARLLRAAEELAALVVR